jgi:hypothetical protein
MIYVVSSKNSNRLKYVLDLVFGQLLGMEYAVVKEAKQHSINILYGNENGFSVPDSGLLWQEGTSIVGNLNTIGQWNNLPTFFVDDKNFSIPFDIFSAIFYLVSRIEEYNSFTPDVHNRFPPEASILVENNWIKKPIVNLWVNQLLQELLLLDSDLVYKKRKFEFISTIDVDLAWKYKNKGLIRTIGGLLSDVIGFKNEKLKERLSVFLKKKEDPFYNFDFQFDLHKKYETDNRYFILLGKRGKYDKNNSPLNLHFRQLIRQLNVHYPVGIHPSYASNGKTAFLRNELNKLSNILGQTVVNSRQHFLVHQMPATYQRLIELGIKEDYTMGYTSYSGFRAGIAAPFYWYDVTKEEQTQLLLFPFCHMDITPRHYEAKSIEKACEDLTAFITEIAEIGGLFSVLWHNESLSNSEQWQGWQHLYVHTLAEAQRLKKELK